MPDELTFPIYILKAMTPSQVVVYSYIYTMTKNNGHADCRQYHIATTLGISLRTISKCLNYLMEEGLIRRVRYADRYSPRLYKAVIS